MDEVKHTKGDKDSLVYTFRGCEVRRNVEALCETTASSLDSAQASLTPRTLSGHQARGGSLVPNPKPKPSIRKGP